MEIKGNILGRVLPVFGLLVFLASVPLTAFAHCDTLDGPVVMTAKQALKKGDVTPVLKWVQKDHEAELKEAFKRTLAVRNKGKDAQELADMYFFETLVRLHRAGEGAPYDGLKPAGELEPSVAAADKALETGSVEKLTKETAHLVTEGIHQRFEKTMKAKKMADKSVEQGREYVDAYVDYVHYVERLHMAAAGPDAHHGEKKGVSSEHAH